MSSRAVKGVGPLRSSSAGILEQYRQAVAPACSHSGNPASRIQESYTKLMTLDNLDLLKVEALILISEGGISEKNKATFRRVVAGTDDIGRLRSYLTNFMLAGAGLGVNAGRYS